MWSRTTTWSSGRERGPLIVSHDVDVAPLAGRLLEMVTEEGRHRELVDAVLRGLDAFLAENEPLLRERFGQESPWWVPDVIDDRIFGRLLAGVRAIIRGDTVGGSDELRQRIDVVVERIDRPARARRCVAGAGRTAEGRAARPSGVAYFLESFWTDVKETLRTQAGDDGRCCGAG